MNYPVFARLQLSPEQVSPARLLSPGCSGWLRPLLLMLGTSLRIPRGHPGEHQLVGMDSCFSFFRQCNLSEKPFLPPRGVVSKQSLDGTEQLLCHRLSQFIKTLGAFFGNFFSLFSLSPSFLVAVEQSVTLSWCCSHIWAGAQPWEGSAGGISAFQHFL